MQAIIGELNGYTSTHLPLEAVRDTLLVLATQDDPALTHAQILVAIREDVTPDVLYNHEALQGPHTIHRIMRNVLSVLGVPYHQHPNTNRVAWGLVNQLFESEEDRNECYRLLGPIVGGAVPVNVIPGGQGGNNYHVGDAAKVTQAITSKFRLPKDKFGGKLGESFDDVIASYVELSIDLEINDQKKFQYMHHLFCGEALRFYRNGVATIAQTFEEANQMMRNEFNSLTRQNRCRAQLQRLRLAHVMRKEKLDTVSALEFIRDFIAKLAGQCPREYREEAHKSEYLSDAVMGNQWATQCLATSRIEGWSFQRLYTALDAAFMHHEQCELARKRDGKMSDIKDQWPASPIGTFYEGQSVYGRPRKPGSKSSAPFVPGMSTRGSRGQRLCFNCGEPGHFIRDCKKPQNIAHTVSSMVKKDGSNAKQILFELSCQSQDAIFEDRKEETFATMFGKQEEEGGNADEETQTDDDENTNEGWKNYFEEEEADNFHDPLSAEDF